MMNKLSAFCTPALGFRTPCFLPNASSPSAIKRPGDGTPCNKKIPRESNANILIQLEMSDLYLLLGRDQFQKPSRWLAAHLSRGYFQIAPRKFCAMLIPGHI
jgi:hypothetical protein